jgi:hypothetical protein
MILPTKGVEPDRALLTVGAEVLRLLDYPKTLSRVWEELRRGREGSSAETTLTFDWFVLSLDLLYAVGAIEFTRGKLKKAKA